jgi:hydroxymethylglutaryl-CoA reductase
MTLYCRIEMPALPLRRAGSGSVARLRRLCLLVLSATLDGNHSSLICDCRAGKPFRQLISRVGLRKVSTQLGMPCRKGKIDR